MQGTLTSRIGLQSKADELMYTIPFRDTVAGDALSILCTCHENYSSSKTDFKQFPESGTDQYIRVSTSSTPDMEAFSKDTAPHH